MLSDANFWYDAEESEVAKVISEHVRTLRHTQQERHRLNLRHYRLYTNREVAGLGASQYHKVVSYDAASYNVIKSIIDTVASKIGSKQPDVRFLTSDADYSLQLKAKLFTDLVQGAFYETDFFAKARKVFIDGCWAGTGFLKIFEDWNTHKVAIQRVFPDEITVDDEEAIYGEPKSLFHTQPVSKPMLIEAFPDKKDELEKLKPLAESHSKFRGSRADQVLVHEAWRLPSAPGAEDGRHTICAEDVVLVDEPWTRDEFPFVTVRWCEDPLGFWGIGLAQELTMVQYEINGILRTLNLSLKLHAVPKWLVDTRSEINLNHLDDVIGGVIKHTGKEPKLVQFQAVNPDLFAQLDRLWQKAYEIAGVSQMSAASRKETGLNSGAALREFYDIESERFAMVSKTYQDFFVHAARQVVAVIRSIAEREGGYEVTSVGKRATKVIRWKDVAMADDQYVIKAFPIGQMPNSPAGKLQYVNELLSMGFLDKPEALALLDFPDLESQTTMLTADIENLKKEYEQMIDNGEYTGPEPYDDLVLSQRFMRQAYKKAKLQNVPDERLELIRTYITQVEELMQKAAAEEAAKQQEAMPPEQQEQQQQQMLQ